MGGSSESGRRAVRLAAGLRGCGAGEYAKLAAQGCPSQSPPKSKSLECARPQAVLCWAAHRRSISVSGRQRSALVQGACAGTPARLCRAVCCPTQHPREGGHSKHSPLRGLQEWGSCRQPCRSHAPPACQPPACTAHRAADAALKAKNVLLSAGCRHGTQRQATHLQHSAHSDSCEVAACRPIQQAAGSAALSPDRPW